MMPTEQVTFTTPDGVKRVVRLTFGARKRVADRFGMPMAQVVAKYDSAAFPDILYCCMFDDAAGGKPPKGLAPDWAAGIEIDAEMETEMATVYMQMVTRGRVPKNELRAAILKQTEEQMKARYGLSFGPSPASVSESRRENSGPAPSENSTPSANTTGSGLSESESGIKTPTSELG